MTYDTDFRKLAVMLLPPSLRGRVLAGIVRTLVQGIRILQSDFRAFRERTDTSLRYDGQTCRLRGMLNDMFDPDLRRITVEDVDETELDAMLIHTRETPKARMLYLRDSGSGTILTLRGYRGLSEAAFRVRVPWELKVYADRMTAMIDSYKLAGMKWIMVYQ